MEVYHSDDVLQSSAADRLRQFIREHQQKGSQALPDFEVFERELHECLLGLEQELIAQELARYDVEAEQIEVGGVVYRQALTSPETYLSAAGPVKIERHLYRPAGRGTRSICPLELRAGLVGGQWTPRAARQAAFVMAHLTSREGEALFEELGGMQPSRSTLDRLPKVLSKRWEAHREAWEVALRAPETVPETAAVLAVSLDGVLAPMKEGGRGKKRSQPDKQPKGPAGYREVGCGAVVLYDAEGERLDTVYYGRMPESKKVTLGQQLEAECQSVLALRPDLKVVKLSDGAQDNWRLLSELDWGVEASARPQEVEIVDFYHACEHLKRACDAVWGEGHSRGKAEFERLRTLLKEAEEGVEQVIRTLQYRAGRARGRRRKRLETELTYFRNQRHRMRYAQYLREHLPIASGVIEAACKTLVTQRLKRSGMAWTQEGGQGILSLRSLIQSGRWERAWSLLRADFCQPVIVVEPKHEVSPSLTM
jgi:hypothetical protein